MWLSEGFPWKSQKSMVSLSPLTEVNGYRKLENF